MNQNINEEFTISKKYYRIKELVLLLSVSRSSIWQWVKKGTFPRPYKLSEKTTAWDAKDIEKWITSRRYDFQ